MAVLCSKSRRTDVCTKGAAGSEASRGDEEQRIRIEEGSHEDTGCLGKSSDVPWRGYTDLWGPSAGHFWRIRKAQSYGEYRKGGDGSEGESKFGNCDEESGVGGNL